MTSGNRCKANKNLRPKLFAVLDKLKAEGKDFCPKELGFQFGITANRVTGIIRERDDVYCKSKAHSRRFGNGEYQTATEPMYYPSLWGFTKIDIDTAIKQLLDKTGGVYTDDLGKLTGRHREWCILRLKERGFTKPGGKNSLRWVNETLV